MSEELERIKFLKKLYKKSEKPAPRYIDLQKENRGIFAKQKSRRPGADQSFVRAGQVPEVRQRDDRKEE